MINIFVLHNREADRLRYLIPRANALASALQSAGHVAHVQEIGPEASGMANRVAGDTFRNRMLRAIEWTSLTVTAEWRDPRNSVTRSIKKTIHHRHTFRDMVRDYGRSLRIEQEVLYAHAKAWEIAAKNDVLAIILESDARFRPHSEEHLVALVQYIAGRADEPIYVDLAGGCDTSVLLNAWCFDQRFGCMDVAVAGIDSTKIRRLPSFTNNTVAGYLISSRVARVFMRHMRRPPMLSPDWAMMRWGLTDPELRDATCLHSDPPILAHGSQENTYTSTIEPNPGTQIQS